MLKQPIREQKTGIWGCEVLNKVKKGGGVEEVILEIDGISENNCNFALYKVCMRVHTRKIINRDDARTHIGKSKRENNTRTWRNQEERRV
jgi:hypothetical protein